jgi:pescadillo protein
MEAFAAPEAVGEEGDVAKPLVLTDISLHGQDRGQLFAKCIFYLSREVPRNSMEFVIRSCGGQVGWDPILGAGSHINENNDRITHHISDRPNPDRSFYGRSYVQPQWVYDCINAGKLLDTENYSPGATLPAHLSPFVKYEAGDYVPAEARLLDETLVQDKSKNTMAGASSDDEVRTSIGIHLHFINDCFYRNNTRWSWRQKQLVSIIQSINQRLHQHHLLLLPRRRLHQH